VGGLSSSWIRSIRSTLSARMCGTGWLVAARPPAAESRPSSMIDRPSPTAGSIPRRSRKGDFSLSPRREQKFFIKNQDTNFCKPPCLYVYTRRKSDQFSAVHGITQHFSILDSAKLAYIKGTVVQDLNMAHAQPPILHDVSLCWDKKEKKLWLSAMNYRLSKEYYACFNVIGMDSIPLPPAS
jgi:hypothetical protein